MLKQCFFYLEGEKNKKRIIIFVILLVVGCFGGNDEQETNVEETKAEVEEQEKEAEEKAIDLGGLTVYVPEGYTGTGGDEGYRSVNAIITLDHQNYEIEVPTIYAHLVDNYESTMSLREHYTGASVVAIETEGWRAPVLGYTYVRTQDDSSSMTDFQEEHGASQIIGLFYENPFNEHAHAYFEIEMRVFEGELTDYYQEFEDFVANYVAWYIDN